MNTTFEKRSEEFNKEVNKLEAKYGLQLYAAQVVLKSGELAVVVKLADSTPKKYDNNAEAGNTPDKKA